MLYVTFTSKDLPKVFMYPYLWFIKEWMFTYYCIFRTNLSHLEFGKFFLFLKNMFYLLFNNHSYVMDYYNTSYGEAIKSYLKL